MTLEITTANSLLMTIAAATRALGQGAAPPPDYGLDWVTVGAPGNAPTPPDLYISALPRSAGAVDHEYRIMRTEVTNGQWFEFVRAYQPYYTGSTVDPRFTGFGIVFLGGSYVLDRPANEPATMSWEYAARYVNWLENGKGANRESFESGAYDTSTFTFNPDGSANHQVAHNPDSQFWIPTEDEWVKATYFDPNRYGPGQPGYWRHPGSQDTPLASGNPEGGGQTNAGEFGGPRGIGSYPEIQSPWGLLDTSGGAFEYTETVWNTFSRTRIRRGSQFLDLSYEFSDSIEFPFQTLNTGVSIGLRIASSVPAPGSFIVLFVGIAMSSSRKSR